MLCLTLCRNRSIYIKLEDGRIITIKGIDPEHYSMRIGIEAPRSIGITRSDAVVSVEKPR